MIDIYLNIYIVQTINNEKNYNFEKYAYLFNDIYLKQTINNEKNIIFYYILFQENSFTSGPCAWDVWRIVDSPHKFPVTQTFYFFCCQSQDAVE